MRRLPVVMERPIAEVKALQIETDQDFRKRLIQGGIRTTCKQGCSHCCSHPFLITIAEGVLLHRWLQENGQWTAALRKRFEDTRDKVLGLSFDIWLLSNIACPLLDDNVCIAYAGRPTRCRIMFSIGDPSLCRPNEYNGMTPILDNTDYTIRFIHRSRAALKKAGVKEGYLMPLAEAVLLGEAVDTGKLELPEADAQHVKDLFRA